MNGDLRNPPAGMTDHDLLVAVFYDVRELKDQRLSPRVGHLEALADRARGAVAVLFAVPTLLALAALLRGG